MNRSCQRQTQDASLALAGAPHDGLGAQALGRGEHDIGTPYVLLGPIAILDDRLKLDPLFGRDHDADVLAHPPDSHRSRKKGIQNRTQMSGEIH